MADTGHGGTITLSVTGGTWLCRNIKMPDIKLPSVPTSYLGTSTAETVMQGDLEKWGPIVADIIFQSTQGLPARGVSENCTVTLPVAAGGSTPATLLVSGFIDETDYPTLATNTLQEGRISFMPNGTTRTWTAQT